MGKIKYVPGMAVTFDSKEETEEFSKIIKMILPVTWCPFVYYKENVPEKRVVWGRVDDHTTCHKLGIYKFSELEFEEKIEYTVEELWNYIYKLVATVEKGGMTFKMMQEAYMPEETDVNVSTSKVLTMLTPDEFVKKSREYYERKKIKPGTVIKNTTFGRTGIVVSDDGIYAEVFTKAKSDGYLVSIWSHNIIEVTDCYISGFAGFIESMNKEEEIWKTEIDG